MKATTTNLKKIATMILVLAGSIGITNAQKAFLFNDIPALLAEMTAEVRNEIILTAESTRTTYNIYYEAELELEGWMTEYPGMEVTDLNVETMASVFEVESESMELEAWMVQPGVPDFLLADQEEDLQLESWMISITD